MASAKKIKLTHYLKEGGLDFIHKPVAPEELLVKVREMLDRTG